MAGLSSLLLGNEVTNVVAVTRGRADVSAGPVKLTIDAETIDFPVIVGVRSPSSSTHRSTTPRAASSGHQPGAPAHSEGICDKACLRKTRVLVARLRLQGSVRSCPCGELGTLELYPGGYKTDVPSIWWLKLMNVVAFLGIGAAIVWFGFAAMGRSGAQMVSAFASRWAGVFAAVNTKSKSESA